MITMKRVLFIDDDYGTTKIAKFVLSKLGIEVDSCISPDIYLFERNLKDYSAIFVDYLFPDENCVNILKEIKKRDVQCPIYIISNYDFDEVSNDLKKENIKVSDYIPKIDMIKSLNGIFSHAK